MNKIIEEIINHIVEKADEAEIQLIESELSKTIAVRVCGCDHGRMVGEKGRTVNMFKRLMEFYSKRKGQKEIWRFLLGNPLPDEFGKMANFKEDPNWDCTPVKDTLNKLINMYTTGEVAVIKVGGNILFEVACEDSLEEELEDIISFLAVAMCKGYGKTCTMEWFKWKK